MSLLSYTELCKLIEDGVVDAPIEHVNGTSIDISLHHIVRTEVKHKDMRIVWLGDKESIITEPFDMRATGGRFAMQTNSVLLASSIEYFKMPLNMSAEFSLKSSLGRNFLCHELAGWIDPGFEGRITLELKNHNQFNSLGLTAGMPIGQVKFFTHATVPEQHSYRVRGQYMKQDEVTPSRGVRFS